jgi:flagellar basal-body rod protein FlgB
MALDNLPLFAALKGKMQWHQARQTVLAQNVANADTPGYEGQDLTPFKVEANTKVSLYTPVGMSRTNANHIQGTINPDSGSEFGIQSKSGWEVTPEGNGVVLEEQMMKVTENAFEYQVASTLYSRSLGILKTALGKG